MYFLGEQRGDIDDLVIIDAHELVRPPEIVQDAGLRNANVDAFQIAYVANVLRSAYADHRENAKVILVVEHCSQIVRHLQVSIVRVRASGYDGDRVLVGLLASVDSNTYDVVADALDIG